MLRRHHGLYGARKVWWQLERDGVRGGPLHGRAADAPSRPARRGPWQDAAHDDPRRARGSPGRSGRARLHRDRARTACGSRTSPTWRPGRAWSTSRSSSTPSPAGSWAGRPTRTCAPASCSTRWRWRSGRRERDGLPVGAGLIPPHDAGSQYLSFAFTQRLVDAGVDASVGSVGDAYDNALAESTIGLFKTEKIRREGPGRRSRRRAGHAGMGRLVQHQPTAFCLRQTLPSAVRAQVYRNSSNSITTASNEPGAVHSVEAGFLNASVVCVVCVVLLFVAGSRLTKVAVAPVVLLVVASTPCSPHMCRAFSPSSRSAGSNRPGAESPRTRAVPFAEHGPERLGGQVVHRWADVPAGSHRDHTSARAASVLEVQVPRSYGAKRWRQRSAAQCFDAVRPVPKETSVR